LAQHTDLSLEKVSKVKDYALNYKRPFSLTRDKKQNILAYIGIDSATKKRFTKLNLGRKTISQQKI